MEKVLITGITGMVGSHLADYIFANTDWEIHGLIRWRSSLDNLSQLVPHANYSHRLHLSYGDIRDYSSIDNILKNIKPNFVFHLAAQSFPMSSFSSPLDTFETNINGTTILLDAIRKNSPDSIVHVCSSSEIFGRVSAEKIPIKEDCTFHPASPYAISKVGTDLVSRYYSEAFNLTTVTTRMFTHTGPRRGDVFAESSFAKQIALAEAGYTSPIIKVGNLKSLRTVADVRDAVRAYYLALTVNPIKGSYYNIGGSNTLTIDEILKYLISLSKIKNKLKVEIDPSRLRPIDADLQIPDTTKFTKHTGWLPEYSFEETMLDLIEYWRERVKKFGNSFLNR